MNNLTSFPEEIRSLLSSCSTNEEALQKISENPENLIFFFEIISNKDNEWYLKNSVEFYSIFKKIKTLSFYGKLDENQIQRIVEINKRVFLFDNDIIKKELNEFSYNIVNKDNVYECLDYAIKNKSKYLSEKCFNIIEEETGIKLVQGKSLNDLHVDIINPKINTNQISEYVNFLSKLYSNVSINLSPPFGVEFTLKIKDFIKNYGKLIVALDLKKLGDLSHWDEVMREIIKNCARLTHLSIVSSHFWHTSVQGLKDLKNLESLYIYGYGIKRYPAFPDNLKNLDLQISNLESLPPLPEGLQSLKLVSSAIESLPKLPDSLQVIDLETRLLKSLPTLPEGLQRLILKDCADSNFKNLPNLPEGLKEITIDECTRLTNLTILPKNLQRLSLSRCYAMTILPALPEGLQRLSISDGSVFTSLPKLPANLQEINLYSFPKLANLPVLPEGLKKLLLSHCNLKDLPQLPKDLQEISFKDLDLRNLPAFPKNLQKIKFRDFYKVEAASLQATAASFFDVNLDYGLKFYKDFWPNDMGKVISEKFDADLLIERFSDIKKNLPYDLVPIVVKIMQKDFNWFLETEDLPPIPIAILMRIPAWKEICSYALSNSMVFEKTLKQGTEFELNNHPEIQVEELFGLFDAINFTDKDQKDYVNPDKLTSDGERMTVEKLREGIGLLIQRIKNNEPYVAVPANEKQREEWYKRLEDVLKSVIHLAKEMLGKTDVSKEEKMLISGELLRLASAGHHCGSRWLGESKDIMTTLSGRWLKDMENKGIEGRIDFWIDGYKEGIMQQMSLDFVPRVGNAMQPHVFNYVGKVMLDQKIALSNIAMIDTNDILMPTRSIREDEIIEKLKPYFIPLKFAQFIKGRINDELKTKPSFGDFIVNTMRGYAEGLIFSELQFFESSLEEKKLEYGIKEAENLLENRQLQKAILSGDTDKIALEEKKDKFRVMRFKQRVKSFDDEEKNQIDVDIQLYHHWLQNKETFSSEIKNMGTQRSVNELRSKKDELVEIWLKDNKLLTFDDVTDAPKITALGTIALLEYLKYFEKGVQLTL